MLSRSQVGFWLVSQFIGIPGKDFANLCTGKGTTLKNELQHGSGIDDDLPWRIKRSEEDVQCSGGGCGAIQKSTEFILASDSNVILVVNFQPTRQRRLSPFQQWF
ncbi:hypothetical protein L917_07561 [Phytophthora nicotianae]|uniref:Uncharacterized protein n=2 Tax=Phytophthora nicotianae TaxID=4792 RepID=V9FB27_PHYNI|nr:hypothetical protein F443_07916 [Phytophthora nicotianae P1569]ETL94478.1 hypothetical protein L917_07561 [Phytophthora nicotianae]ETM47701.1 hypothetical protein L914_07641 [Phytophthora nicotianae]